MLVIGCSKVNNIKIFGKKPIINQPKIDRWLKIKKGMTYQEVTQILGKEKYKVLFDKKIKLESDTINLDTYYYGSVKYNSKIVFDQWYYINFLNDRVYEVYSSIKDLTTKVSDQKLVIYQPFLNQKLSYAPIDIRWNTLYSPNEVIYEISAEWEAGKDEWISRTFYSYMPYFPLNHVGANNGRVKIRGISNKEFSLWSDYVYFKYN